VVSQQTQGKDRVRPNLRGELRTANLDDEIEEVQADDLLDHVGVEADQGRQPRDVLEDALANLSVTLVDLVYPLQVLVLR
jgi:hypothetical protein